VPSFKPAKEFVDEVKKLNTSNIVAVKEDVLD
jgi:hypothetical protein